MNSRALGLLAFSTALGGLLPVSAQPAPAPRPPSGPVEVNGIAVIVNGKVITKSQVSFMLAPVFAQLAAQFPRRGAEFERQFNEARERILLELIDREIIIDEFKLLGASIKQNIVDEEVKRQVRDLYNGDEARFREELRKSRLTMDRYREMTREKMIVQAMRAQKFSDAPPPLPNEISREYAEIKDTLRDMSQDKVSFQKIFIPRVDAENPASTPEIQLTLAEDLAKQIQDGKDIAELAKTYSKDAFAEQGGIQNDVPRTDLSPEFAAIVFDAPEGKLLGPLEDPQGFTLVKITKKTLGPAPGLV